MVEIDRPIFIIGTGRCGSSLLYRMMSYHPDVAWISHFTSYLPGGGYWAAVAKVHDLPGLTGWLPSKPARWVPQATENYRLLNEATDAVFTRPDVLTEDDVTPEAAERMRAMVRHHLAASGKDRFVMKHTGFPRVRYLRAIFPDAKFVHVIRDGRAVAASLCKVDWWAGESAWGWGTLSVAQRAEYEASGYHELILAGLYWKTLMGHLGEVPEQLPSEQLHVLRYDQLVADPATALREIVEFADLPWDTRFKQRIAATAMTSDDTRWRRTLTPEEQDMVEASLQDELALHGFLP